MTNGGPPAPQYPAQKVPKAGKKKKKNPKKTL
jgi:hypothetical protein